MVLGFKHQFVYKIWKGEKIHTIREDKPNRWKTGVKIHMATGVRTKNYTCFDDSKTCTGLQRITLKGTSGNDMEITINKRIITSDEEIMKLVKNDGFDSYDDFFSYFFPLLKKCKNHKFSGFIIHWTDFRY